MTPTEQAPELIVYELTLGWKTDPAMAAGKTRGAHMLRFYGTPAQLRTIMDCAESFGFDVASVYRTDAMTAEAAVKQITNELRVVALVQQPSKLPAALNQEPKP